MISLSFNKIGKPHQRLRADDKNAVILKMVQISGVFNSAKKLKISRGSVIGLLKTN